MKTTEPPNGGNLGTEKGAPELESGLSTSDGTGRNSDGESREEERSRETVLVVSETH